MLRLFFVRHGQTDWNIIRKMQGSTDIVLNDVGIQQAYEARKKLSFLSNPIIYSSDLQRATKTAQIIGNNNSNIIIDKKLREINMGKYEGVFQDDIPKSILHKFDILRQSNINYKELYKIIGYDKETLHDVYNRLNGFLKDIQNDNKNNKNIIIVTHRWVIRLLKQIASGLPLDDSVGNGSINEFTLLNNKLTYIKEM